MTTPPEKITGPGVDRVRELASVGADRAARAFAELLGRPCRLRSPIVFPLDEGHPARTDADRADTIGVFFEVQGGPGGVVGLLLPSSARDHLLERLVGDDPEIAPEKADSAIREFANIVVSHVASGMSDRLGERVIPSVPVLVLGDASKVLATLIALRGGRTAALRIDTEISDRAGRIRAHLVLVPDRDAVIAPAPGF